MHRRSFALALAAASLLVACGSSKHATAAGGCGTVPAGLPTATCDLKAKPVITIPKTDPPTTLQKVVLVKGTGPVVAKGDTVSAQYVGVVWRTGKQFDASWDRGQAAAFPVGVGQLVAGWDETLPGETYGSRILLVVPPDKGYGAGGQPAAGIEGTDTMIFVVDLVSKAG
jgi:peptidylprolyl isomerase